VRVGILGGTFNPPHLGHLVCAQEAYLHLGLDQVILIPASDPPHKAVDDEPGAAHRLELCRLAVDGDDRFAVSDIELAREGPSYTVDTLEVLNRTAPENELFLIIGADIAAGLPSWHHPERVLALSRLAIAERSGTGRETVEEALRRLPGGERAQFFPMPTIAISSSAVRDRVRAQQPIRYLVPGAVAAYINDRGLYGGTHRG
jgi:nicotinate-nucleotide adenylyltransferase